MHRKSEDRYRQRNRQDEGLLRRIRNDVKSWFDDDDDNDVRESESRSYRAGGRSPYAYEGNEHERNQERRYRGADETGDWHPAQGQRGRFETSYDAFEDRTDDASWEARYSSDRSSRYAARRRAPYVLYAEYWAAPGPFAGVGPKGFQRSSTNLKERVCERLEGAGDIDASNVEVEVDGGEVTLTGTVGDRRQKRLVEDCAESVYGVRDVHNQLRIDRSASGVDAGYSSAATDNVPTRDSREASDTDISR